mmetsp:Transcript_30256/g.73627  ORF Transcript_30256/g.73627 Transcript_30256/m.73627 type:complete len:245 (+) Transcript_30256:198-932(+)
MKFSTTTFVFSTLMGVTAAAVAVGSGLVDKESVARSIMSDVTVRASAKYSNQKNRRDHRELQATEEECDAANEQLFEDNTDLSSAVADYVTNVLLKFFRFDVETDCTPTGTTFLVCDISGPVEGEQAVIDTCAAAGGQQVSEDDDLECVVTTMGQTLTVQFDFPAAVGCIPTTLNGTAIDCSSFVPPSFSAEDLAEIEQGLVAGGLDSAECRAGELSPVPSASFNRFSGSFTALLASALFYMLV